MFAVTSVQLSPPSLVTWTRPSLEPVQLTPDKGALAGSWELVGPWAPDGGRVYTTALCCLSLIRVDRIVR